MSELKRLRDLQGALDGCDELDALVAALAEFSSSAFGLSTSWLYLQRKPTDDAMQIVAVRGRHEEHVRKNLPEVAMAGDAMLIYLAQGKGPILLPTAEAIAANNEAVQRKMQNQALMAAPVIYVGAFRGVIGAGAFLDDATPPLGQDDVELYALVSAMVSAATARITEREFQDERARLVARMVEHERLETVRVLAAGMVHDLRNMLGVVTQSVEMLKLSPLDAGQLADLVPLTEAIDRAQGVCDELLGLGGAAELDVRAIPYRELEERVVRLVEPLLPDHVELVRAEPGFEAEVPVDAPRLVQVFVNLIVNARDALGERGGTIRFSCRTTDGDPSRILTPGPMVVITVQDDGEGMSPNVRDRVFEPFFSTKARGEGTGLGLATARSVVEQHGGWIECQSERGVGTSFSIYLPSQLAASA
ncbi:MAG: two-component system sensor histidine kinase NtrB [Nannocystaceae bacterium]|nr:HAMP domain-containing histidine kinase [bacterium]